MKKTQQDTHYKYYAVQIQINSGAQDLFYSTDKVFIDKVSNIIYDVLAQENSGISYNINIADKQIIDNSVTIKNETTNYISNYDIKVEHHGLSKEDLEFILGDFKKSIENLDVQFQKVNDSAAREQLKEIVNEINSEKPSPNKIKKLWESAKTAADGYETIAGLADFGDKVMRAAMMFV